MVIIVIVIESAINQEKKEKPQMIVLENCSSFFEKFSNVIKWFKCNEWKLNSLDVFANFFFSTTTTYFVAVAFTVVFWGFFHHIHNIIKKNSEKKTKNAVAFLIILITQSLLFFSVCFLPLKTKRRKNPVYFFFSSLHLFFQIVRIDSSCNRNHINKVLFYLFDAFIILCYALLFFGIFENNKYGIIYFWKKKLFF